MGVVNGSNVSAPQGYNEYNVYTNVDLQNGIYNVKAYGAMGDGVTDDTSAIQLAITMAQRAGGGKVYLPPGTYLVTSTLNITSSFVTLEGDGPVSVIKSNFAAGNVIYAGRSAGGASVQNVTIANLKMVSSIAMTSGAAIYCQYAERFTLRNLYLPLQNDNSFNFYDGIRFDHFDNCVVSRCSINSSHYGIAANGHNDQSWGADLYIHDGCKIGTNHIAGSVGLMVGGAVGGLVVTDTDIIGCDTGVLINSSLGGTNNRELFFGQAFIDSSGNVGMRLDDNSACTLLHLSGTWVASSGQTSNGGFPNGSNISVGNGLSSLNAILEGCRIFNAYGSGMYLNSGTWTITGCSIHNNGQGAAGGHGIILTNTATNFAITGNSLLSNGNATLGNGINIGNNLNNFLVANNVCRLNGTANLVNNSSTATNMVVSNNMAA